MNYEHTFVPTTRKTKMTCSNTPKKSNCGGEYRYELSRIWDKEKPKLLFIMLNPSTADAIKDDPTIRRIVRFSKSWGYGGLYVGNLYAFRSTDPKGLKHTDDPIGPHNISHIKALLGLSERVIYAWGNNEREPDWLRDLVDSPYCIDTSKKGVPKHPLYLKSDLQPKKYTRKV
jgi:hypothetical protein